METRVRHAIESFEEGKTTVDQAVQAIRGLTGKEVDAYALENYWRSESLDTFVRRLCARPIEDWRSLTDSQALELIREILSHPGDDVALDRNAEALGKRYAKPQGTVLDLIFDEEIGPPERILVELKKDTVIYL